MNKSQRSRLTIDLSAEVTHIGFPSESIYLIIFSETNGTQSSYEDSLNRTEE